MAATATITKSDTNKSTGVYSLSVKTFRVAIDFNKIGSNIADLLTHKIVNEIEGKCIEEGFVKPGSVRLQTYSSGELMSDYVTYSCVFEFLVCNPVEGMQMSVRVKNVTKAGIRAELDTNDDESSPIVVFIARDHHFDNETFQQAKEGDTMRVRIIGIRFELNDKYISAIAEAIRILK